MRTLKCTSVSALTGLTWDSGHLAALLGQASRERGRLLGRMQDLSFDLHREAQLNTLTEDVVRSSEIEGEKLDSDQVRSSIARRLGMDVGGPVPADRDVEGVVEMMLDATTNYAQPLTADRLIGWHAALFPTGRIGLQKITVGNWRDDSGGPMQVVSRPTAKQKVHYEAPPAARVPEDMDRFLSWFEAPGKIDSWESSRNDASAARVSESSYCPHNDVIRPDTASTEIHLTVLRSLPDAE
jgi:Fic family protein